jgi:hypothetical protein
MVKLGDLEFMKKRIRILLALAALASASLACVINLGGPALPPETIPILPEAASQMQEKFMSSFQAAAAGDGSVVLTFTEVELTSLLAARLASQADPLITDPQVFLRDDQIRIFGKAQRGMFAATIGIVLSASVDSDGRPAVSLVSADFGPLPAPEGLEGAISDLVNEAYTGALGPLATGFRLEGLTIRDGTLTFTGRLR